mmetsp:Transcript_64391/g.119720  ORF Transcript_64391/g.119720 Transcript_64391/m.119720 type:complete len:344 (+) Transcript_64391:47-1078(+)
MKQEAVLQAQRRLEAAQASGDIDEIRAALLDAKEAGGDPAQIEQALQELDQAMKDAGARAQAELGPEAQAQSARDKAEALKKKGNELLKDQKKSSAKEALECFTLGLQVGSNDQVLNGQLYSNRAHVRMLLRQFVEAVDDCRKAIECDPKNLKAYWRAGKASLHMDLCRNALDFCNRGLEQEPNDADLARLRDTCAEKLAGQQQRKAEIAASSSATPAAFNSEEAFAVQERVTELAEQLDALKGSLGAKQREKAKANITKATLGQMPGETSMYISVGRTFLKQEKDSIETTITRHIENLDEEIPKLTKAAQEIEKRKEDANRELQEMVAAFRRQADQGSSAAS